MSPHSPALNPSLAVERIREVIVGRQLEKLEQRVVKLESSGSDDSSYPELDERVLLTEARVEALQESVSRLTERTREEIERRTDLQREEIHRLARQIQHAATVVPEPAPETPTQIQQLDQKLGIWLTAWKNSIQQYLETRDSQFTEHFQREITSLRGSIDHRFADLEAQLPSAGIFETRFQKIADAARALADSAATPPA